MTDEKKGAFLFCYAIALAARQLDHGDFHGLNSTTFLAHVERLLELGIKTIDPENRSEVAETYARSLMAEVYSAKDLHQADLDRSKPRLVWSSEDPPDHQC